MKKKIRQIFEKISPKPMQLPVGMRNPPTLQEQMAQFMRASRLLAEAQGRESFEEANDFDVGDDYDPNSPWEEDFEGQFEEEANLEKERERRKNAPRKKFVEEKPLSKKDKKNEDPSEVIED